MFNSKFISKFRFLVFILLTICLASVSIFAQVSQTTMAELKVIGKSSSGKGPAININGENSIDSSSLVSPAKITVPADTRALINFGKAGQIELSPQTNVILTFNDSGVTIDLTEGRLRITSLAQGSFNIKTVDGLIANDRNRSAVFITEVVGGSTGVSTEAGTALVNGIPVPAGEVWTADPARKAALASTNKIKKSPKKSVLKYVLLGAAGVGAGILIGVAASGNNN